jgi:tail assembly chaperone
MNGPVEYELGDRQFVIHPIPPVEQFHIQRRFAPVVRALARINAEMTASGVEPSGTEVSNGIMEAFGEMKEEDVNYLLSHTLSRVMMRNGPNNVFAPIWGAGGLMFNKEITYPMLLQLVLQVIQENLGPSMPGPSEPQPEPGATSQAA